MSHRESDFNLGLIILSDEIGNYKPGRTMTKMPRITDLEALKNGAVDPPRLEKIVPTVNPDCLKENIPTDADGDVRFSGIRSDLPNVGSCNGLVCLFGARHEFIVWNPNSGKFDIVPRPPKMAMMIYGFGYDKNTKDYKVVAACVRPPLPAARPNAAYGVGMAPKGTVFACKKGSWKTVGHPDYCEDYRGPGVYCKGALYWAGCTDDDAFTILKFDLGEDKFRTVCTLRMRLEDELPLFMKGGFITAPIMGALKTCPCVFTRRPETTQVTIWMVKGDGIRQKFTTMDLKDYPHALEEYIISMDILQDGRYVLMRAGNMLLLYDVEASKVCSCVDRVTSVLPYKQWKPSKHVARRV